MAGRLVDRPGKRALGVGGTVDAHDDGAGDGHGVIAGHDHDWDRCVVSDRMRDVTEVQRGKPARSCRAQHEQVGPFGRCRFQQGRPRVALQDERSQT